MKVLLTGAAGFIGSNLAEKLVQENIDVIGIDNDKDKAGFLNDLAGKNNFTIIWDDINKIQKYYDQLNDINIVYHLAASADIQRSYMDPTMDLENNVLGTNAILEFMRQKDIKKLIFASSSAIYGECKITPTPENVADLRPISMYGASKLANEAFIHSYSDLYAIRAWMFRFANVVGKHQHRGVIFDFFHNIKKNPDSLKILGDGNQIKSYFDVFDCVTGLTEIYKSDGNKSVEIYNLGNTEVVSVRQLAEIVCDELEVYPEFFFTGGDRGWKGDVPVTILSIEKALKAGWKPIYSCEESIRRTVRYLHDN